MLELSVSNITLLASAAFPAAVAPFFLISLCVVAAIGTVLLIPSRREGAIRKIGGTLVLVAAILLASTLIHNAAQRNDPMGVYFWVFSGLACFGALRVITHRRPVYSALYFILTVFASAGLFVLLSAEFMAAALILIYAGAILVTYVFVIMLAARAGAGGELSDADQESREPIIASAVGFGLMCLLLYVLFDRAPASLPPAGDAATPTDLSVRGLAGYLFNDQLVNIEVAGVLLTLAMVGAIVIARRRMWSPIAPPPFDQNFEIGNDDPHDVPVSGTTNPRQKAYPEA